MSKKAKNILFVISAVLAMWALSETARKLEEVEHTLAEVSADLTWAK